MASIIKTIVPAAVVGDYSIQACLWEERESYTSRTGPRSTRIDCTEQVAVGDKFTVYVRIMDTSTSRSRNNVVSFVKGTPERITDNEIIIDYQHDVDGVAKLLISGYSNADRITLIRVRYILPSDGTGSNIYPNCKVIDLSKTAYTNIPTTVDLQYSTTEMPETTCSNVVVKSLAGTFSDCTNLISAPSIPSNITSSMSSCFKNCTSLRGNIIVDNDIQPWTNMFDGTTHDIFIIKGENAESIKWRIVANAYPNVHYETDDAIAPVITDFKAIRVDASGDTTPEPTGLYAYVTAKLTTYETNIPVGWTNEIKAKILTDNGSTESPTWHSQSGTDPLEVWCWISLGDTATHELSLQITDSIKEGSTEKKSQQSQVVYASILKSYALVDYYHDENASGVTEGMAIGKYAEYANLFDIDMPTKHRQEVECPDMTAQEVQDFIDSLDVGGGGTAVDFVIEEGHEAGINGELRYKKWKNGFLEIDIFLHDMQISHYSGPFNGGWYAYTWELIWNNLVSMNVPSFVDTNYSLIHSWNIGSGVTAAGPVLNKTASKASLYATSNYSGSNSCQINIALRGRWK